VPVEHARRLADLLKKEHGLDARSSGSRVLISTGKTMAEFQTAHGKLTRALQQFRKEQGVSHAVKVKGQIEVHFKK